MVGSSDMMWCGHPCETIALFLKVWLVGDSGIVEAQGWQIWRVCWGEGNGKSIMVHGWQGSGLVEGCSEVKIGSNFFSKSAAFLLRMPTTLTLRPPTSSVQFSLASIMCIYSDVTGNVPVTRFYIQKWMPFCRLHLESHLTWLVSVFISEDLVAMFKESGVLDMEHVNECIQHVPNNWYCFSLAVVFIQATGLRHHEERHCLMSSRRWKWTCTKCVCWISSLLIELSCP